MSTSQIIAFAVASALLIAVPGPSVLFVIGRALALGKFAAWLSAAGNALGTLLLAGVVAIGLGPLLQRSETLLLVVKLVGAAYLMLLGYRAVRSAGSSAFEIETPVDGSAVGRLRSLREGFVVGVLNPKSLVFFSAALPQFVNAGNGNVPFQIAMLGLIFSAIALTLDSGWAFFAGSVRGWFARDSKRIRRTTQSGGIVMIALGGGLAFETALETARG